MGRLCLSYKLALGPWSADLEAAAARLSSSSSTETETDDEGYTTITSPAGARDFKIGMFQCAAQCGACSACLEAEQVLAEQAAIISDLLLMRDAWEMQLWMPEAFE